MMQWVFVLFSVTIIIQLLAGEKMIVYGVYKTTNVIRVWRKVNHVTIITYCCHIFGRTQIFAFAYYWIMNLSFSAFPRVPAYWILMFRSYSVIFFEDASQCGVIKRRNDGKPWWSSDEISILKSPMQCLIQDTRPGAVMTEYNDIYDRSRPDNVSQNLSKVTLTDLFSYAMLENALFA